MLGIPRSMSGKTWFLLWQVEKLPFPGKIPNRLINESVCNKRVGPKTAYQKKQASRLVYSIYSGAYAKLLTCNFVNDNLSKYISSECIKNIYQMNVIHVRREFVI